MDRIQLLNKRIDDLENKISTMGFPWPILHTDFVSSPRKEGPTKGFAILSMALIFIAGFFFAWPWWVQLLIGFIGLSLVWNLPKVKLTAWRLNIYRRRYGRQHCVQRWEHGV